MNVKELTELLDKLPPMATVFIECPGGESIESTELLCKVSVEEFVSDVVIRLMCDSCYLVITHDNGSSSTGAWGTAPHLRGNAYGKVIIDGLVNPSHTEDETGGDDPCC